VVWRRGTMLLASAVHPSWTLRDWWWDGRCAVWRSAALPASYTGWRYPSRWWGREVAWERRREVATRERRSKVLRGWGAAVATLVATVSAAVVVPVATSTTVLVAASSTAVIVIIVAPTVVVVAAASVIIVVTAVTSTSATTAAAEATAFVGATH